LRAAVGEEFRRDAEAAEADAAIARLRARTLVDVAVEAMHRGDRITVHVDDHGVEGRVVHVADDLAIIRTERGDAYVNLRALTALEVAPAAVPDVDVRVGGATSLRALLLELELGGGAVRIVGPGIAAPVEGRLRAVAADHVLVATRVGDTVLALSAVGLILPFDLEE